MDESFTPMYSSILGPKLRGFVNDTGVSGYETIGVLFFLWNWARSNADEFGVLKNTTRGTIAKVLRTEWASDNLDTNAITDALIANQYIDEIDGVLSIHDWGQHQRYLISYEKKKEKDKLRQRKNRSEGREKREPEQEYKPSESPPEEKELDENPKSQQKELDNRVPVITLTLNDKSEYPVYEDQCAEWSRLYPAVDVPQQLRNMRGWLDANPAQRKTKNGVKRFINTWLSRQQDKGSRKPDYRGQQQYGTNNPFLQALHEEGEY